MRRLTLLALAAVSALGLMAGQASADQDDRYGRNPQAYEGQYEPQEDEQYRGRRHDTDRDTYQAPHQNPQGGTHDWQSRRGGPQHGSPRGYEHYRADREWGWDQQPRHWGHYPGSAQPYWHPGYRDQHWRNQNPLPPHRLIRRVERQGFYHARILGAGRWGAIRMYAFDNYRRPVLLRVDPISGRVQGVRYV